MKLNDIFRKFAIKVATIVGRPWAFIVALITIFLWALTGPVFGFSNRWQLVINTGTTIVTLLMVFIIQNTQNRDSKAIHIKLDELINGIKGPRNMMVNVEDLPDEEIEELHQQFKHMHKRYTNELERRGKKIKSSTKSEIGMG